MDHPSHPSERALPFWRLSFFAPSGFVLVFGILLLAGAGSEPARESLTGAGSLDAYAWLLTVTGGIGCAVVLRGERRASWWSGGPRVWPLSLRVLIFAVICLLVFVTTSELRELHRVVTGTSDFGILFGAARALAQGNNPYTDGPAGYFYPPLPAVLGAPLTLVPVAWASVAWFGFKLWLLSWSVRWVANLLPLGRYRAEWVPWVLLGTIACTARFWMADLRYGNTNIVVTALVLCSLHSEIFGDRRKAGICLAIASALKVVPIVLVVWFAARGSRRSLLWTCGTLLVLCAAVPALAPIGVVELSSSYWDYGVVGKLAEDLSQPDNQSLLGALSRMPWPESIVRTLWVVGCGVLCFLVGMVGWLTRKAGRDRASVSAALCPALILAVSPGSWVVHYVMAMLPLAMVMAYAYSSRPRGLLLWVFWGANAAFTLSGWSRPTVKMSIEQSWFLAALLALFASLVWLACSSTNPPSQQDP